MTVFKLDSGEEMRLQSGETVIVPVGDPAKFDINEESTWESDRFWVYARRGQKIVHNNKIHTIVDIVT